MGDCGLHQLNFLIDDQTAGAAQWRVTVVRNPPLT
jgi:hypothetical protein